MSNQTLSLLLVLGATLCFSLSSLVFSEYSKRVSVLWMNCFKACVAAALLFFTIPLLGGWHQPSALALGGFMLSGFIGLNIGDIFLLSAFTKLGVARTLILFGFQPLFVGIAAYYLFDQPMNPLRLLAVIFLIGCLVTFSLERYRTDRNWEIKGLLYALTGVFLDTIGILITRAAFSDSPQMTPVEGHFYRCLGALVGFAVISLVRPIGLVEGFRRWAPGVRSLLVLASFGGTYLSLLLYLWAIKIGHLASITGVAITGPMFATGMESFLQRKPPSRYLIVAFLFFCAGFYILLTIS